MLDAVLLPAVDVQTNTALETYELSLFFPSHIPSMRYRAISYHDYPYITRYIGKYQYCGGFHSYIYSSSIRDICSTTTYCCVVYLVRSLPILSYVTGTGVQSALHAVCVDMSGLQLAATCGQNAIFFKNSRSYVLRYVSTSSPLRNGDSQRRVIHWRVCLYLHTATHTTAAVETAVGIP